MKKHKSDKPQTRALNGKDDQFIVVYCQVEGKYVVRANTPLNKQIFRTIDLYTNNEQRAKNYANFLNEDL